MKKMNPILVLGLLLSAWVVEARRIPTYPIEITAQDRGAITKVLGVDPERVRRIRGWSTSSVREEAPPQAIVYIFEERIGERVLQMMERHCGVKEQIWQCSAEDARNRRLFLASLPEPCPNASERQHRILHVAFETELTPERIDRLLSFVCTSEEIRQKVTPLDHTFSEIRIPYTREDVLRVSTVASDLESGTSIDIEEWCEEEVCRFVIRNIQGWMT